MSETGIKLQEQAATSLNKPLELIRFSAKEGANGGVVHILCGGVHYMWRCSKKQMLAAASSALAARLKMDD